ncbi:MAG: polysaccharide biosynthesis protein [Clostridia bacterium]|nr:polysaccharide biosynthesis protein [Clostridia bacterium]
MFGSDGLRGKNAIINFLGSTGTQIIGVICGFIVPRIIIGTYGSEMNGVMQSIAQFLSYITLLESGVGGVIRAALYKPLAQKDNNKVSGIVMATEGFFRKICLIFVIYSVALACIFPYIVEGGGGWLSTFAMVLIISLSTISQYYFGITYNVLLQADQKRYVYEMLGAAAVAVNALLVFACASLGASVHVMKLVSSLVFAIRPMFLNLYVKKKYDINRKIAPDKGALSQRWDGMGHHIAFFLHSNTDIFVLTMCAKITKAFSLAEVSVYSVYYSVVYGIEKIVNILHLSVEAAFGNMLAKGEKELFKQNFRVYELLSMMLNTFIFTATAVLLVPFVSVYTGGIDDADYIRPLFSYIIVLAEALYCLRKPYNNVTNAAGHYRQTKKGAYLEAAINVALSIILVVPFGITGVAAATALAMGVRTFDYVRYLYKNLLEERMTSFFKILLVNAAAFAVTFGLSRLILPDIMDSYLMFFAYAVVIALISGVTVMAFNFIFFPRNLKNIVSTVLRTVKNFLKR